MTKNANIFSQNDKDKSKLFHEIERACAGLIYVSETDEPVTAFAGSVTGSNQPVEERDFAEFFSRLTANRDWHGAADKTKAKKFLALQKLLEENLRDLRVLRFGERRIDIFIVGTDNDGRLMGVRTKAVET